ncbi:hypothetical protein D0399_07015 [Staphylococcus epidermidis]|nr:hypothetical protein [Staphylococcus epidermidis]
MQNLNRLVKKNLMILIRAKIECFSLFFYKKLLETCNKRRNDVLVIKEVEILPSLINLLKSYSTDD